MGEVVVAGGGEVGGGEVGGGEVGGGEVGGGCEEGGGVPGDTAPAELTLKLKVLFADAWCGPLALTRICSFPPESVALTA